MPITHDLGDYYGSSMCQETVGISLKKTEVFQDILVAHKT